MQLEQDRRDSSDSDELTRRTQSGSSSVVTSNDLDSAGVIITSTSRKEAGSLANGSIISALHGLHQDKLICTSADADPSNEQLAPPSGPASALPSPFNSAVNSPQHSRSNSTTNSAANSVQGSPGGVSPELGLSAMGRRLDTGISTLGSPLDLSACRGSLDLSGAARSIPYDHGLSSAHSKCKLSSLLREQPSVEGPSSTPDMAPLNGGEEEGREAVSTPVVVVAPIIGAI